MLDIHAIREQFPALRPTTHDVPVVYLDNAATSQKPQCVIDCLTHYYSSQNANVHRGSHKLTEMATAEFETARSQVAQYLGAATPANIIWTRGATESLNLIAQSWGRIHLTPGDEILISEMEHHANIVPWQLIAEQTGAQVVKIPMTPHCELDWEALTQRISDKTKLVAIAQMTNVTGYRAPLANLIKLAHQHQAIVVVDGAQGILHAPIDVSGLNIDFYVFSGHKIYAPTGIGVLYGKMEWLEAMPPYHGGGKMVKHVSFDHTSFAQPPAKFEAGTPNIAGAIALATALQWYQNFPIGDVESHIHSLQHYTYSALSKRDDVKIIGYQPKASMISFVVDGIHHQDIATLLDQQGVAVRAGHHCAHPLMDALNISGTIRVSFAIYNTVEDVNAFLTALDKALALL